jgi:Subtilase family/Fibronectin type-III domain/PA domain/Viral BACON domain/Peptidase inhibitor I9
LLSIRGSRLGKVATAVTVLVTTVGPGPAAGPVAASPPAADTGLWIVQLSEPSLAAHEAPSGTVDVTTVASQAYLDRLADEQTDVADNLSEQLGRPVEVEASYRNVLNAIAIEADPVEVPEIAAVPGVESVEPDVVYELTTDASHDLISSAAIWDGDTGPNMPTRGEGVVVGMLDSGINPFHPSFAATDGDGYTHTNPYNGYLGVCNPAHPHHDPICNDKLVGAWSFVPGNSARDTNGHGSHTASTAAGNRHEVTLTYGADTFTRTVQGVAPRANLIAYRVCIDRCPVSSILAGINQAVADGVDVLNYSISGTDRPWSDSVSRAFLEAFGAGIFVAAAAGNTGPDAGTVAQTAPWNASVAASDSDRTFAKILSVLGPAPVPPELASVPGWPGFGPGNPTPIEATLRYSGQVGPVTGCTAFPAGRFAGAIALIPTGTCTPAVKITNAANAGAQAAVLFERHPGPPVFLSGVQGTAIPAVSVTQAAGEALQNLVTTSQAPVPVRLGSTTELVRDPAAGNAVAWFSSRGPSDFDLLAPTVAAPGVNILAAYREEDGDPRQYEIIRGTSMASPHVAGSGALLRALHPDWSPAEIRAALAGTADPTGMRRQDGAPADAFDVGAGLIDLSAAGRVGLVLDESYADMLAANPATGGDPRTLNVPYLVNRQCNLVCEWSREVTSVADAPASYTATVAVPAGMTATVEPAAFTLAPGATQPLTVTVDVSGSSRGDWVFADLQLATGDHHAGGAAIADVHYPVAVIPVAPAISVDPTTIDVAQKPDRVANRSVVIRNQGTGPLEWELTGEGDCDAPADVPWLSVAQESGTVPPGGSTQVRVTLDSSGQDPGVLAATLCVASNDPAVPLVEVAVTLTVRELPTIVVTPEELTVTQPAGTITGTPLTIGNTGTSALEWSIGEAPVVDRATLTEVDPGRQELLDDGVLLVPNTALPGVAAFDPKTGDLLDRAFITYPQSLGTTTHIILNAAQDGFLVSSQTQNVVHAFDLNGEYQGVFAPIGGADTSIMGNIRGMSISPWGTLLVTSATGRKVVEFDANGKLLGDFISPGAGGIRGPWYILFREADVLVADSSGKIYQYDHNGAPLSVWQNEINFPQQLYRQANGNVLAAAFSSPAGVWELDPDGGLIARYTGVAGNRGAVPLGNGNILTTNSGGVHEIDRGSALVETKLAGSGVRMISQIERFRPCDEPDAVPWLNVSDASGTTPAGGSSEVTVLVDSTGLAPGVHEAHLCVNTNDPERPLVEVPVTVTVTDRTCDRTITGTYDRPVRVASGLTCLAHGSVVTGPVRVGAGASLHATGTELEAPLRAEGAGGVELYGSVVTGPVSLREGTTQVALIGNHITGPVSLARNTTAPTLIVVAGNTVVGPLACDDNEPPPVNNGQPNMVSGPASGQCRDL